jgi:hypothetical protein
LGACGWGVLRRKSNPRQGGLGQGRVFSGESHALSHLLSSCVCVCVCEVDVGPLAPLQTLLSALETLFSGQEGPLLWTGKWRLGWSRLDV